MKDFGSYIKTVEGNEGDKCNYPTRLDTYGCGCQHDCDYCYAKSLLDFRGLWDAKHPAVGDMRSISRQIMKCKSKEVVRLGGMTDCFQPMEKLHRITYKTISLLNRKRIPYLIVTKSALVGEPEYIKLMDKELAQELDSIDTDIDFAQLGFVRPEDIAEDKATESILSDSKPQGEEIPVPERKTAPKRYYKCVCEDCGHVMFVSAEEIKRTRQ